MFEERRGVASLCVPPLGLQYQAEEFVWTALMLRGLSPAPC